MCLHWHRQLAYCYVLPSAPSVSCTLFGGGGGRGNTGTSGAGGKGDGVGDIMPPMNLSRRCSGVD